MLNIPYHIRLPLIPAIITVPRFTTVYKYNIHIYTVIRDKHRQSAVNIPRNTVNVAYSDNVPGLYAQPFSRPPEPFRLGRPPKFSRANLRIAANAFISIVNTTTTKPEHLHLRLHLYPHLCRLCSLVEPLFFIGPISSPSYPPSSRHNGFCCRCQGRRHRQQDPREAQRRPALLQIRPRRCRLLLRHPRRSHTCRCVSLIFPCRPQRGRSWDAMRPGRQRTAC